MSTPMAQLPNPQGMQAAPNSPLAQGGPPSIRLVNSPDTPRGPAGNTLDRTALGTDFSDFMIHLRLLEHWFDKSVSLKDRITAYRKIWFNDANWDQVIKTAKDIHPPFMWSSHSEQSHIQFLKDHDELVIGGRQVDISHLFAGSDAANHIERSLDFTRFFVQLSELLKVTNVEFAGFIGDLGSVVARYLAAFVERLVFGQELVSEPDVRRYYDGPRGIMKPADLAGDADGIVFPWNSLRTVDQNMEEYYLELLNGTRKRFTSFARLIGLGELQGETFTEETGLRLQLEEKVIAGAKALIRKIAGLSTLHRQLKETHFRAASTLAVGFFLNSVRDEVKKEATKQ
jgi:hypothetical protein